MIAIRIDLLGPPRLWRADSTYTTLCSRHALVLAYLALKDLTTRDALGELLWPGAAAEMQSNNLRQLLFQLRKKHVGQEGLREEDKTLRLSDQLTVDAVRVLEAFQKQDWATVVDSSPHLLGQHTYDVGPELYEWLEQQRQDFARRHALALGRRADQLEQEGQQDRALELAVRRLRLDPWSDEACRAVMALSARLGDPRSALREYEQFRERLRADLDQTPEAQTAALARTIRERVAEPRPATPRPAKRELPPAFHAPPLVGQEQALASLDEAWRRRVPVIYVCSQAGGGKTRLMAEFAAAHAGASGGYFYCSAAAGDASVPLSSKASTVRSFFRKFPQAMLDRRSRKQLGRIVPELWKDAEDLQRPSPGDPAFEDANFNLYKELGRHVGAIVFDNGQYLDRETIGLGLALEGRLEPLVEEGAFPPILVGIRPGELPPEQEEILRTRADRGLAAWIDVEPLTPDAVRQLMAGMGLLGFDRVSGEIAECSGGSPAIILEIVRELVTAEGWNGGFPADFQLGPSVRALLDRKLKRLSPEALRVARALALGGEELTTEMVASVTRLPFDHLAVCFRELERHHLVHGRWFTSGPVVEAVLEGIPEPTRAALLQRIADCKQLRSFGGIW